MNPLDIVGRTIEPGCRIVYGRALGRCAALGVATVIVCERAKINAWASEETWRVKVKPDDIDKPVYLRFPERIAVIQSPA